MREKNDQKNGFSLIEVLIVLALFIILVSSATTIKTEITSSEELDAKAKEVVDIISKARDFAAAGYFGDDWGIRVLNDNVACGFSSAWQTNYSYRRPLTIDNTLVSGSSDLSNVPVLVSFTDTDLKTVANGGKINNSNGFDIVFADTDLGSPTKYNHEIESYNASTGEIIMWVKIPTLDYDDDTTFYMYYGNSSISTTQENATGVWDSNYVGVWHMDEDPSISTDGDCGGGSDESCDSTSNNNDLTAGTTMTSGDKITAKIGNGTDFDGSTTDELHKDSFNTFGTTSVTEEFWINSGDGVSGTFSYAVSGGDNEFLLYNTSMYINQSATAMSVEYRDSTWHHVAITWTSSGGALKFYLDGNESYTGTHQNGAPISSGGCFVFAQEQDSVCGGYNTNQALQGTLDEVRVSDSIRSADWIKTQYNNQANQGTGASKFIKTLGTEEALDPVGNDCVILFKGKDYDTRTSSYDRIVNLSGGISINAAQDNEFYFAYNSGFLSTTTGTSTAIFEQGVRLDTNYGGEATIIVDKAGVVFHEDTGIFDCGTDKVRTIDGLSYATVKIGSQCWTSLSLNTNYQLLTASTTPTNNHIIEKHCYSDLASNCSSSSIGGLYTWDEAMNYSTSSGARGVCPFGWHLASDAEWDTLEANYPSDTATALKASGESGFDVVLGGLRYDDNPYAGYGSLSQAASFWTSTQIADSTAQRHYFDTSSSVTQEAKSKLYSGFIRCLKDS